MGTKLVGDHLSRGTKLLGTICPGGPNLMGTVCPWESILLRSFVQGDGKGGSNGFGTKCVAAMQSSALQLSCSPEKVVFCAALNTESVFVLLTKTFPQRCQLPNWLTLFKNTSSQWGMNFYVM